MTCLSLQKWSALHHPFMSCPSSVLEVSIQFHFVSEICKLFWFVNLKLILKKAGFLEYGKRLACDRKFKGIFCSMINTKYKTQGIPLGFGALISNKQKQNLSTSEEVQESLMMLRDSPPALPVTLDVFREVENHSAAPGRSVGYRLNIRSICSSQLMLQQGENRKWCNREFETDSSLQRCIFILKTSQTNII